MQSHGPKRVYTPQSLEFWFDRLENDWAAAFSATQLEAGRQLYRDGEIRELELTAKDAIIHRRVEKRDEYAVIEWDEDGLSVRSSTTDQEIARALAVAGLHEIEELVADEIPVLPEEAKANGHGVTNGRNGHAAENGAGKPAAKSPAVA
ncbi:MAG TPA: ATP-dependent helicase, partial [Opitutaceae bacterium]|nr:ATP-dependent helicase [Opitutaceae bacterium]